MTAALQNLILLSFCHSYRVLGNYLSFLSKDIAPLLQSAQITSGG